MPPSKLIVTHFVFPVSFLLGGLIMRGVDRTKNGHL